MGLFLMALREQHKVNGRFYGVYYETAGGFKIYLAHRQRKQIFRERYAWCIDVSTLERFRARGVKAVGVIVREAGKRLIWLTLLDDFFDSPYSFAHWGDTRQRGLPLSRFRIDPVSSDAAIAKAVRIR